MERDYPPSRPGTSWDLVLAYTAPIGLLSPGHSSKISAVSPKWITFPGHSLWLSIQSPALSRPLRIEVDPIPLNSRSALSLPTAQPE